MDFDFSNYIIYIPECKCSGSLYEKVGDFLDFPQNQLYTFEKGIKKLQEENRGLHLPVEISSLSTMEFFHKKYNIFAC